MELFVNFSEIWKFFKKNILIFLAVVVVIAGVGGVLSVKFMSNQYSATSTIVVTCEVPEDAQTDYRLQYTSILSSRVQTAIAMANGNSLIEETAAKLDIDKDKIISIGATQVNTAPVIRLTINCYDYNLANTISDAAAEVLSQRMMQTFPSPPLTAVVNDKALPAGPHSTASVAMKGAIMGGVLGVILVLCFGVLKVLLDRTIRSTGHVAETLELPLLGTVSRKKEDVLRMNDYRKLRAAVCSGLKPHSTLLVNAACPNNGNSQVAFGLAKALSMAGMNVLLLDADFANGELSKLAGVQPKQGAVQVMGGACKLEDAVVSTGIAGVSLLGGGAQGTDSADVLAYPKFKELMEQCRQVYDYVLVDTPAERTSPDAASAAASSTAVLLVAKYGSTSYSEFRDSCRRLRTSGGKPMGFVLTEV